MPFDAATTPAGVLVIDKVLEILGPNGEHWTQRESNDGNGHRCIMGAVRTNGDTAGFT